MTSMGPPLGAIFFMTYCIFTEPQGAWPFGPDPGSATAVTMKSVPPNKNNSAH